MAVTITNRLETVFGNKRVVRFDVALGTYAAAGISLTPADLGMTKFDLVLIAPQGGLSYTYNSTTQKIMAFRSPATTSTGVISAPITVSQANITVSGPAAATTALLKMSDDSATAILTHASGAAVAVPPATLGIPVPTAIIAPVFTGGASTTAVMAETTGALSTATRALAIGE